MSLIFGRQNQAGKIGSTTLMMNTEFEDCFFQGFSRVMTRPCRVIGVSKSRGSGRVGSTHFTISRVGSGRVKRFQNLAGRVGSGQEASEYRGSGRVGSRGFKISPVGSGRVMTREIRVSRGSSHHDPRVVFRLTRGSNPRIWPADPPFSNLLQLRAIAVQAPRGSVNTVQNVPLPASLVPMLRSYVITACRTITRHYP